MNGQEPGRPGGFRQEIGAALRYERGLVVKAIAALAVVAVIVVLRTLYFS
ncbi:MAG TPA: hypothetical protein VGI21_26650 [Streptosporangiaceae bacterium]